LFECITVLQGDRRFVLLLRRVLLLGLRVSSFHMNYAKHVLCHQIQVLLKILYSLQLLKTYTECMLNTE